MQSLALWTLCWQQVWQRRTLNRAAPEAALYPALGLANQLTILRGLLIAATGGLLLQLPDNALLIWAAALLYSIAAILDRVDGFVARRTRQTSLLGSELDTVFDALGLVVAPLLAVLPLPLLPNHYRFQSALRCFRESKPHENHEARLKPRHEFERLASWLLALIPPRFVHDRQHVLLRPNQSTLP